MAFPRPEFAKWMEFSRPGLLEELVPGIRSESRDTREACFETTEIYRAKNSREISAERAHGGVTLGVRLDTDDEEYRGARERCQDRLRDRCGIFSAG
jgi:hypothetical protein